MNILFVHPNFCKRSYNQIKGWLKEDDVNVNILSGLPDVSANKLYYNLQDNCNDTDLLYMKYYPYYYKTNKKFIKRMVSENDIDLIYAYGMPDDLIVACNEINMCPVVYDVRDVATIFSNELLALSVTKSRLMGKMIAPFLSTYVKLMERKASELSAGLVVGNEPVRKLYKNRYSVKKSIPFENYALEEERPSKELGKYSEVDGNTHFGFTGHVSFYNSYRNYFKSFKEMAELGLHVHINPITREPDVWSYFRRLCGKYKNIHVYTQGSMMDIMNRLSRCDFGLLPEPLKIEQGFLDIMLPNKLFDYLACNLPVASIKGIVINEYLYNQKAGFVFTDTMDLYRKLDVFDITRVDGSGFTIEAHMSKLVDFCRGIVDGV